MKALLEMLPVTGIAPPSLPAGYRVHAMSVSGDNCDGFGDCADCGNDCSSECNCECSTDCSG